MGSGSAGHTLFSAHQEVHRMGEDKKEGVVEKHTHKLAFGGRIVAALSILFLVPVIRKLRAEQQHHKHRRHFPILGH
jgi:hypothetical protein